MEASGSWTIQDQAAFLLAAVLVYAAFATGPANWPRWPVAETVAVWGRMSAATGRPNEQCKSYMKNNFKIAWESKDGGVLLRHHYMVAALSVVERLNSPTQPPAPQLTIAGPSKALAFRNQVHARFQRFVASFTSSAVAHPMVLDEDEEYTFTQAIEIIGVRLYGNQAGAMVQAAKYAWTPHAYVDQLNLILSQEQDRAVEVVRRERGIVSTRGEAATEFRIQVDRWLFNLNPQWNYPQLMWAIFVRRNHNAPRSVQHSLNRLGDLASADTLLRYERVVVDNFEAHLVNIGTCTSSL